MGFRDFVLSPFSRRSSPIRTSTYLAAKSAELTQAHVDRFNKYKRHLRAYEGYSIRGSLNTSIVTGEHRVKFNFVQPVVNLSAGWFAAHALTWDVDNDPKATKAAHGIWDRSGGERNLLENAICCGIYGDIVGIAATGNDRRPRIEFVDPTIATPTFDGSDYSKLVHLELAFTTLDDFGREVIRREFFGPTVRTVHVDDTEVTAERVTYDHLPVTWIRNSSVKGLPYGMSDVEPILELVEEYDHIASKQTRIVDYYAAPNIVFKGIQRSDLDKDLKTVFFVPEGGDAKFLEWSGGGPEVEKQLTRMRNAIAEISQVPPVAFGQADSGLTSISGVAIQILYGPLLSKTDRKRANWGPALEYLMWRCLVAEGFTDLELEQVNVRFPSATPVDGQAKTAEASAKVAARVTSRRTIMNDLGIENPDSELKRIVIEEKLLQLTTPVAAQEQDASAAARAGGRGIFTTQVPVGVGQNKAGTITSTAPVTNGAGMSVIQATNNTPSEIDDLIARFDAIIDAENESIMAAEAPVNDPNDAGG